MGRTVMVWHKQLRVNVSPPCLAEGEHHAKYSCTGGFFYRVRVKEGESDYYGSWNGIIREKGLLSHCVCMCVCVRMCVFLCL